MSLPDFLKELGTFLIMVGVAALLFRIGRAFSLK